VNDVIVEAKAAADATRRGAAKLAFWMTAALFFGALLEPRSSRWEDSSRWNVERASCRSASLVNKKQQNQNQKDDYYQPEASATVIAGPIKRPPYAA